MRWIDVIGLGVAGNFTGHLEQAGEASDFESVAVVDSNAPKGIFPFYVPAESEGAGDSHPLHQMPISSDTLRLNNHHENHQIEPEVALLCELTYEGDTLTAVTPRFAMAHNDCSIRRAGAQKISEKKNWGPDSKGTSNQWVEIDTFSPGGVLDKYRLSCFLLRNDALHEYGVDSPVSGYSYFYKRLIDWLILRMNTQIDEGPLEDISALLMGAGRPAQALISVGATRYTEYGESHFLRSGDQSIVMLYDETLYQAEDLPDLLQRTTLSGMPGLSVLKQTVVPPNE